MDGVVSPQSADHANLGELVGKGVAPIGRTGGPVCYFFGGGLHGGFGCFFPP